MPTVRRSRTLSVPPEDVWTVVGDPYHLPRWWPRVTRVEGVDPGRFTEVLMTKKGRAVRADYRLTELSPPQRAGWAQELEDTPFERLLSEAVTEVELAPAGEGTRVTITLREGLRGWSRFAGFLFRRAARRRLDEALDGLVEMHDGR